MTTLEQWWQRAKRCGHGYAQVSRSARRAADRYFVRERQAHPDLGRWRCRPWRRRWRGPRLGLSLGLLAAYPVQALRIARGTRQRGFALRRERPGGCPVRCRKLPEALGVIKYRLDKLRQKRADHHRVQGAQPMNGDRGRQVTNRTRGHPRRGLHRRLPPVRRCSGRRGWRWWAVCDLSRTRAERLAAQMEGAQVYTDLERMIAEARPDVVHVLMPPTAHFAPAKQLLEAGVAVFAEKPLAVRSEDCAALGKLAAERGLALGVGHNFLFAPAYERLIQDVTSRAAAGAWIRWTSSGTSRCRRCSSGRSAAGCSRTAATSCSRSGRTRSPTWPTCWRRPRQMQVAARDPVRAAQRSGVPPALGDPGAAGPGRGAPAVLVHRRLPRALRPRARLGRQRHGGLRAVAPTRLREHIAGPARLRPLRRQRARGQGRARAGGRRTLGSFVLSKAGLPFRRRAVPDQHHARRCAPSTRGWPRALPMDRRLGADLPARR